MKKLFAVLSLMLFAFDAAAQFSRETTFEDRPICEENKGVWREFGDICINDCESQFDQFKICDRAIRFSCDCGPKRCWKDKKCIRKSDYKKFYEANLAKEEKELEEAKKIREAEAKANRDEITDKLVKGAEGRAFSIDIEGATNNYADFYHDILDDAMSSQIVTDTSGAVEKGVQNIKDANKNLPEIPMPEAPPIAVNPGSTQISPAFLEQEKAKQQQQGNNGQNQALPLPVIPLPK
jgi:hypothetical protein